MQFIIRMKTIITLIAFWIFALFITDVLTWDPEKVKDIRELTGTFRSIWKDNKVSVTNTYNECTEEEKTTWKTQENNWPVKDCFQYTMSEWLKIREREQENIIKMIEAEARPV